MIKFIKVLLILAVIGFSFYYGLPYLTDKLENNNEMNEKLKNLGYTMDEIKIIYNKLKKEEIKDILNIEKNDKLIGFIEDDYFKFKNLERYIIYNKKNNFSAKKIVMYVNIGLDKEFYSDIKKVTNTNNKLVLVNKYNSLPKNFEAQNLITFNNNYSYNGQKMEKTAAESMMSLIDEARNKGYTLMVISGYRTESYQTELYNSSLNINGKTHADMYSARPRHSEHQTGLSVDISNIAGVIDGFEKYEVYNWIKENAYKYGFIERYPKGKEFITGYGYEPWHYRYLGVEAATVVYNKQITFEEYTVKYLNY